MVQDVAQNKFLVNNYKNTYSRKFAKLNLKKKISNSL